MKHKHAIMKALCVALFLAVSGGQVGCGDRGAPTRSDAGVPRDAQVSFDARPTPSPLAPRRTGFGISPQGGTVTSVTPSSGGGLAGGGTSGALTLGLLTSCSSGQILKYNGSAWACADAGGGIGSGTIGNLAVWTGSASLGDFAGASCGSGSAVVGISGSGALTCGAIQYSTVLSPSAITGTNDDYAPTGISTAGAVLVTSSSGTPTITSIVPSFTGRVLTVFNADASNPLIISSNAGTGTAANRITGPWGTGSITLPAGANANAVLLYTGTRWRVVGLSSTTLPSITITGTATLNGNVALGDASADTIAFNGSASTTLNMNAHKVVGVTDPTSAQDVATKNYVDTHTTSGSGTTNQLARWSSTSALAAAAAFDNGSYTKLNETVDGVTVDNSTFSAPAAFVNNYAFPSGARTVVLNTVGAGALITGIAAPSENYRRISIFNNSGNCIAVYDDNTNSTITNRIKTTVAASGLGYLCNNGELTCIYDPNLGSGTAGRWACGISWAYQAPTTISVNGDVQATGAVVASGAGTFGGNVTANGGRIILSPAGGVSPIVDWKQTGQTEWQMYQIGSDNNLKLWNSFLSADLIDFDKSGAVTLNYPVTLTGQSVFIGRQVITASGTYTPSSGTRKVMLKMCGAGGGSGGAKSAATGGGAGGAYLEKWIDPGALVTGGTATIGAAGSAGAATPTNGGNGGDTSVVIQGVTYTAKGGLGSVAGSGAVNAGAAGQSGSTSADINKQGDPGVFGVTISSTWASGSGGSSPFGSGGVGVKIAASTSVGNPGTGFCSGASGGADSVGGGIAGAVGTAGKIIIEEWR